MANLTTLTNREIFGFAHGSAKKMTAKLGGHYSANFTCALRALYADIREAKAKAALVAKRQEHAINHNNVNGLAHDALMHPRNYTAWEREFIFSVAEQAQRRSLSVKQIAIVNRLVAQHYI